MADILESGRMSLPQRIRLVRSQLKRSQAILRLVPRPFGTRAAQLRTRLGVVRSALAPFRDSQALIEAIDDLRPGDEHADKKNAKQWRAWFVHRHRHAVNTFKQDLVVKAANRLRVAARTVGEVLQARDVDEGIFDQFRKAYRKARRRMPPEHGASGPDALHHFRKAIVAHLYQLELLLPSANERLADLETLRKSLGKVQDLEMLRRAARNAPASLPKRTRLLKLIRKRQKQRVRKAIRLAHALFGKKFRHVLPKDQSLYGLQQR